MGIDFRFFCASDFAPGAAAVFVSGFVSGFDSDFASVLGLSTVGVMMISPVLYSWNPYTFASGGSATPPGGKHSGTSSRATPIRLSAIP